MRQLPRYLLKCINLILPFLPCSINGVPACANTELLTNMVRTEMGFRGYVVSDAGAVDRIQTAHHYTKDAVTTAAVSMAAGCNLELSSTVFMNIPKAINAGL